MVGVASSQGVMSFVKFGHQMSVYGGPYRNAPPQADIGVCLLEQIPITMEPGPCNQLHMPIRDFSVPNAGRLENTLLQIAYPLGRGREIYIGCMGGRGRTGLFMACILKAVGVEGDPVKQARLRYSRHAVETEEQEAWVRAWGPSPRFRRLFTMKLLLGVVVRIINLH